MKIISVVNQKGGVGKTTTSLNISTALAVSGYKILTIDFDSQGNLSSGFGIGLADRENKTIYDVLVNENININDIIFNTKIENLDVLVANINLSAFELDVVDKDGREFILQNIINKIENEYDYIIIDCPPSLNLLTINALVCSDYVLIPLQCEFFALEGLSHLLETLERIKQNFNSKLTINGVLLTMYDRRNKLTEQVENDVRECLKDLVYESVIPRNVKLTESTSFGIPTIIYDQHCSGSIAYINFAKELINRLKNN